MSVNKITKELPNKCVVCGKPCRRMYCCSKCKFVDFKKRISINNCLICGKPCSNLYCSRKCSGIDNIKEAYKATCEFCGKEFTYKIPAYKKRGQMRFCSYKCQSSKYIVDDNFFKGSDNISQIYQTMGFIFASGVIMDIKLGIIDLIAEEEKLKKLASTINSTYKIRKTDNNLYRTYIRSAEITNYLFDLGFTSNHETHQFPTILPEYKLDFIKGFASVNSELHQNEEIMFVKVKSYSIAREITEILQSELVSKHLGFICIVREPKILTL
jgi:hypothetical protein